MKAVAHQGYREATDPEGLSVEMRFFQRQGLAWMMDQETGEGGVATRRARRVPCRRQLSDRGEQQIRLMSTSA